MTILGKRRAVQKLLGTALPDVTDDLHYFRWQPSEDLSYYVAYVKFGTSREQFIDLMQRMNMDFHNTGGDANLYLPAAWDVLVELEWWDPDPDTPVDAAARAYGTNGWIVAKYEHGDVYLTITDTGHSEGTPGPW
jgi:hypothetical protein